MAIILLAAGGTGGHIFPAITLAKALKLQGYHPVLYTDRKVINVESCIFPLSKPSENKLKFLFSLMYSCLVALYKIGKLQPKLVVGFGSYASFPILLATKVLSIPMILHEQNSILGRVNRLFFKSAKLIATSFPETKYAKGNKCVYTGNFIDIKVQNYSISKIINLLIIAGSQGADFFDNVVSNVIYELPFGIRKKIIVTQQCTRKNIKKVKNLYRSKEINCELSEFFYDIRNKLANTHLVISRAGGTSIAEIMRAERPAIYIPYLHSKDNHQFYNAKYAQDLRAAIVVEQNSYAKKNLKELLLYLLRNSQKLLDMSNSAKNAIIKDGITEFINVISQLS